MKVFKYAQLISIKSRTFNVADFYIHGLSNYRKIAVQKNHLVSQVLYRSLNSKKTASKRNARRVQRTPRRNATRTQKVRTGKVTENSKVKFTPTKNREN